jgi:vesicle-associated membrane protein 7
MSDEFGADDDNGNDNDDGIDVSSEIGKFQYACMIGDDRTALAESGLASEEVSRVVLMITKNVRFDTEEKRPFGSYSGNVYVYLVAESTLWIVAAAEGLQMRKIMGYLETVRGKFTEDYDGVAAKLKRKRYEKFMHEQLAYWGTNPEADRISSILTQVNEVKGIMIGNLEAVLDRGQKLEVLQDQAAQLEESAQQLHAESRRLRCAMCKKMWCCCCCFPCCKEPCGCCDD